MSVKSLEPLAKLGGKWPADLALAAPDPSPHDNVPGWPFRNYLSLLAHMFPGESVRLLAMRARGGRFDAACSLLFTVQLPGSDAGWAGGQCPRVGGWEGGKVRSRRKSRDSRSKLMAKAVWQHNCAAEHATPPRSDGQLHHVASSCAPSYAVGHGAAASQSE